MDDKDKRMNEKPSDSDNDPTMKKKKKPQIQPNETKQNPPYNNEAQAEFKGEMVQEDSSHILTQMKAVNYYQQYNLKPGNSTTISQNFSSAFHNKQNEEADEAEKMDPKMDINQDDFDMMMYAERNLKANSHKMNPNFAGDRGMKAMHRVDNDKNEKEKEEAAYKARILAEEFSKRNEEFEKKLRIMEPKSLVFQRKGVLSQRELVGYPEILRLGMIIEIPNFITVYFNDEMIMRGKFQGRFRRVEINLKNDFPFIFHDHTNFNKIYKCQKSEELNLYELNPNKREEKGFNSNELDMARDLSLQKIEIKCEGDYCSRNNYAVGICLSKKHRDQDFLCETCIKSKNLEIGGGGCLLGLKTKPVIESQSKSLLEKHMLMFSDYLSNPQTQKEARMAQGKFIDALECDEKVRNILKELNEESDNLESLIDERIEEYYARHFEGRYQEVLNTFNIQMIELRKFLQKSWTNKKVSLKNKMETALKEIDQNYSIENLVNLLADDDNTEESRRITELRLNEFVFRDRSISDQIIINNFQLPYTDEFKDNLYEQSKDRGSTVSVYIKKLGEQAADMLKNIDNHTLRKLETDSEPSTYKVEDYKLHLYRQGDIQRPSDEVNTLCSTAVVRDHNEKKTDGTVHTHYALFFVKNEKKPQVLTVEKSYLFDKSQRYVMTLYEDSPQFQEENVKNFETVAVYMPSHPYEKDQSEISGLKTISKDVLLSRNEGLFNVWNTSSLKIQRQFQTRLYYNFEQPKINKTQFLQVNSRRKNYATLTFLLLLDDDCLKIYSLKSGNLIRILRGGDNEIKMFTVFYDGDYVLATIGTSPLITLWDFQTGRPLSLIKSQSNLFSITFMELTAVEIIDNDFTGENGISKLLITTNKNQIELWNWISGKVLHSIETESPVLYIKPIRVLINNEKKVEAHRNYLLCCYEKKLIGIDWRNNNTILRFEQDNYLESYGWDNLITIPVEEYPGMEEIKIMEREGEKVTSFKRDVFAAAQFPSLNVFNYYRGNQFYGYGFNYGYGYYGMAN